MPTSVGALAHWSDNGILLFEGQRNAVEMAQEDLLNRLSNRVNFSRIDFDHDFLLWLMCMCELTEEIPSSLKILSVLGGGFSDESGNSIRIRGDNSHNKDTTIQTSHAAILKGGEIDRIRVLFSYNDVPFQTLIDRRGNIEIDIREVGNTGQETLVKAYAILADSVAELFLEWEKMEPDRKYPSPSYLVDMYQVVSESSGAESIFGDKAFMLDSVIGYFTLKRNPKTSSIADSESEGESRDVIQTPEVKGYSAE